MIVLIVSILASAAVIAGLSPAYCSSLQEAFSGPLFRFYRTDDLAGEPDAAQRARSVQLVDRKPARVREHRVVEGLARATDRRVGEVGDHHERPLIATGQ